MVTVLSVPACSGVANGCTAKDGWWAACRAGAVGGPRLERGGTEQSWEVGPSQGVQECSAATRVCLRLAEPASTIRKLHALSKTDIKGGS